VFVHSLIPFRKHGDDWFGAGAVTTAGKEGRKEDHGLPVPLEPVATGATSPPLPLLLLELVTTGAPSTGSTDAAAAGCFGCACLVTWIVRRITLVWTTGLSATVLVGAWPGRCR
jgi:hypothetical protein